VTRCTTPNEEKKILILKKVKAGGYIHDPPPKKKTSRASCEREKEGPLISLQERKIQDLLGELKEG